MLFVLSLLLSTLQLSTAENFVRCEVDGNALCETTLCTGKSVVFSVGAKVPKRQYWHAVFDHVLSTPISFAMVSDQKLVVLVLSSLDYQDMIKGRCTWNEAEQQWQGCNFVFLLLSKAQVDGTFKATVDLRHLPQADATLHFIIYNDGVLDATVKSGFYRTISGNADGPGEQPDDVNPNFVSCNPSLSKVWEGSASECTEQHEGGACAWCNIRANGEDRPSCVFRDGVSCDEMADSPFTQTYCNIGFSCPASAVSVSSIPFFLFSLYLLFN